MAVQCAWSCHKIELTARRYRRRCPRPAHYPDALAAGANPDPNLNPDPGLNPNPNPNYPDACGRREP